MTDDSSPITSMEQLDALRAEGRISEEEYNLLSEALDQPKPAPAAVQAAVPPRRLRKSWRNRQIGGVCGGIANYFDIDAWILRFIFVVIALGSCGTVLLVYLGLYVLLPWDEDDEEDVLRFPTRFVLPVGILWVAMQFVCLVFLPRQMSIWEHVGGPLPPITLLAINGVHLLNTWAGIAAQLLLLALLTGLYVMSRRDGRMRKVLLLGTCLGLILFTAALVFGLALPVYRL